MRPSTPPTRLRPVAFPRIRAGGARTRATIRGQPGITIPRKVLKGGSHLCAPNYCRRYRPAARHPSPSTPRRATSDFAASFEKGAPHEVQEQRTRNDVQGWQLDRRSLLLGGTSIAAASALVSAGQVQMAQAQVQMPAPPSARKPNILVIFGDDIGIANISAYSDGLMGYETPNIDRIGQGGHHASCTTTASSSCTAGRAAFLTGQHGIRTGLTKVGFPGAPMGMSQLDPSIGGLLKNLGYATGQFGKNHVGDRNDIAADRQRLRRVLRQPLPPQRRGGAGAARLSEGPGLPRQVRPARRAQVQGHRRGRPDRRSALRQGRQADHRGHRRAHQEAHGDDRRRDLGRGHRLHEAAARRRASRSSAGSTRRACTCARTSAPSTAAATSTATASTSTA